MSPRRSIVLRYCDGQNPSLNYDTENWIYCRISDLCRAAVLCAVSAVFSATRSMSVMHPATSCVPGTDAGISHCGDPRARARRGNCLWRCAFRGCKHGRCDCHQACVAAASPEGPGPSVWTGFGVHVQEFSVISSSRQSPLGFGRMCGSRLEVSGPQHCRLVTGMVLGVWIIRRISRSARCEAGARKFRRLTGSHAKQPYAKRSSRRNFCARESPGSARQAGISGVRCLSRIAIWSFR